MGITETSLEAYKEVIKKIGKRQGEILRTVIETSRKEDITNMEIAKKLGWSINRVTPRVLELRKAGMIEQEGTRKCKITGRTAMTWKYKES